MKQIFMCPPDYFDVVYQLPTNRWMKPGQKPDKDLARRQWQALYEAARQKIGVRICRPKKNLPDMTFMANAGLPYRNMVILSNFFHPERRPETDAATPFFRQSATNENMWSLASDSYFEGQGDALWLDTDTLVIGHGIRTQASAVSQIESILKIYNGRVKVIPLPMKPADQIPADREIFYHLDTCLVYLRRIKAFLVYEYQFLPEALTALSSFGRVVPVTREEANNFICNSFVVDPETIFMPWVSDRVRKLLTDEGYRYIHTFNMSEFLKSGGAVKCLILEHNQ